MYPRITFIMDETNNNDRMEKLEKMVKKLTKTVKEQEGTINALQIIVNQQEKALSSHAIRIKNIEKKTRRLRMNNIYSDSDDTTDNDDSNDDNSNDNNNDNMLELNTSKTSNIAKNTIVKTKS